MDIRAALTELRKLELWPLGEPEVQRVVTDAHALMAAAESVLARAGAELERRGTAHRLGVSSTRRLVADLTRANPGRAGGWTELGLWLEAHREVAEALAGGSVSMEHARIISSTMTDLPADLPPDAVAVCEAFLLDAARTDDPNALRRRGMELVHRLCPDDVEEMEEQAVNRRELFLGLPVQGRVSLRGWLDTEAAELVRSVLSPLAAPRPAVDGEQDPRSPARRNADALVDLIKRAADHGCVPSEGYTRPHITLTVDIDDLTAETADHATDGQRPGSAAGSTSDARTGRRPGTAHLAFLGPLSRAAARRLACDAEVTPITLNENLVPLDVGRSTYVVGGGLRKALVARDRGCAFPACGRPPTWCDAHHIRHWADGGTTALTNLALLCGFHHRRVHHDGWAVSLGVDGHPWFTPPPWVDPQRQPRPAHTRRPHPPLPTVA